MVCVNFSRPWAKADSFNGTTGYTRFELDFVRCRGSAY